MTAPPLVGSVSLASTKKKHAYGGREEHLVCALATHLHTFAYIPPLFAHSELLFSPVFAMVKQTRSGGLPSAKRCVGQVCGARLE